MQLVKTSQARRAVSLALWCSPVAETQIEWHHVHDGQMWKPHAQVLADPVTGFHHIPT
jgi:hypothetical protein